MNKLNKKPLISVLMPVFNGKEYLADSINSILKQTYSNFELIIINDGSKDNSEDIIKIFTDTRIKYYYQTNHGLAQTLNYAISLAKGIYLARMDQDDISMPERFEQQVSFLEKYPDYAIVGTWADIWVDNEPSKRCHKHPSESYILKFHLLFDNPFVHSSMMIRKSTIDEVGLYCTDEYRQPPEDYELWSRIARVYEVSNIPKVLHIYREAKNSMSRVSNNPFAEKVEKISKENLSWTTKEQINNPVVIDIVELTHGNRNDVKITSKFKEISNFLLNIIHKYENLSEYHEVVLKKQIKELIDRIFHSFLRRKYGYYFGNILIIIHRMYCKLLTILKRSER